MLVADRQIVPVQQHRSQQRRCPVIGDHLRAILPTKPFEIASKRGQLYVLPISENCGSRRVLFQSKPANVMQWKH